MNQAADSQLNKSTTAFVRRHSRTHYPNLTNGYSSLMNAVAQCHNSYSAVNCHPLHEHTK